jgi:trimethylamine:corrinoid methyltransferase-like protein
MFNAISENAVELLAESVLEVLEKVGFMAESREILKAYEDAGAQVDYEKQSAKFPRKVISDFIDGIRSENKEEWEKEILSQGENRETMYSGYHPYGEANEFKTPTIPYMFHNLSTYFYDDEKKERRPGNKADFITLIKMGDSLHPENGVGHALNLMDTHSEVEPIEAALVELEYSKNPRGVYVHDVRQIPYLMEMEEIFGIKDPYWHWMANICCNSPLKLDKTVCERFVYTFKTGIYPAKLAAMPVAGVNMPVTTSGSVVIVAAEFIAVWLAARLIAGKKIPLTGMPIQGTMDMRSGNVSFTAFDATISRLAVCDFIKKWTGIRLAPGPGEFSPTKVPGLYCALEKAYFAMTAAAFTGYHPELGVGHIDSGLTISPVQLLLDIEYSKALKFLEQPLITKESIGLDNILKINFGLSENYAISDHTIDNMFTASWSPDLISRNGWSPEIEKSSFEKAKKKVAELIAAYKKPEGNEDKVKCAKEVLEKAKKELVRK